MKKFITKLVLAAIILINAANVTAQNRCVLKNERGSQMVITYPENTMTFQHNDHMATIVTKPTIAPKEKGNAPTHTLTINAPVGDEWDCIFVCDSFQIIEEFYQDMGDSFPVELEEGTYYVLSTGSRTSSDFAPCLWVREDIALNEDVVIDVDYDECVFSLSIDAVDEHGNSFDGIDFETSLYVAVFDLLSRGFCTAAFYQDGILFPSNPLTRYNGFNESSILNSSVSMEPGYQKSYFLRCGHLNGLHEDHTFTITADDYSVTQELFPNANNCSYSLNYFTLYNNGVYLGVHPLIPSFIMEPSIPYTIVSNDRIIEPTNFDDGSKTYLQPSMNEWSDEIYSFNGSCVTTFCFNTKGEVVRGARPSFFQLFSWPNPIPYIPAMSVKPNDKLASFGERTPLATYSPMAFNANNSPYNITFIKGGLFFGGENSCERPCDYDCNIKARINGEEFYNDNLYKYNLQTFTTDLYPITIDVNNDHLFANDVHKTNKTHVEFDLRNDDAIPSTMTFLRVLDGNGDESICLSDLSQSTLVFACADFTYSFTGNIHMEYNAEPEMEVFCSYEQDEWEPLVLEEVESLFDEDYGNVFTADLGQLESRALNKWVSLKFVLADEAGNSQTQELSNVFYAGENVSVNEHIAESLKHTVYPNPFTSEVKITAAQAVEGEANIAVYNVLGEQVYSKTYNCAETKEFIIDGSTWKPGVYFYSISTKDGLLQGKILKE